MMADKSDVLELLRIADLAKEWPNLRPLHDHAMTALQKIADEHAKTDAEARKAEKEKAEAEKAKAAEAAAKPAETKTVSPTSPASATHPKDDDKDEKASAKYPPPRR